MYHNSLSHIVKCTPLQPNGPKADQSDHQVPPSLYKPNDNRQETCQEEEQQVPMCHWSKEHPFPQPLPVSSQNERASLVLLGVETEDKVETKAKEGKDKR